MEYLISITTAYLIEAMLVALILALGLRFMAHRASREDQLYYSSFSREIEKRVERDDIGKVKYDDIEKYIEGLLDDVATSLPRRGVRVRMRNADEGGVPERMTMSVREYVGGSQSLIHSLKGETNAFKSNQKPNFAQLAYRVMAKDTHWVKLNDFLPIDGVIRMIDVLPGIFIVLGIFGTFVGITNALPHIAEIDFNNLSDSSDVLTQFVKDVSFAMYTSIAGIAFSLIVSLLNTLFPIKTIRDTISRQVEDCLEYLWYFVHGGRSESQQTDAFSRMIFLLENIDKKINDSSPETAQGGGSEAGQTDAFSKMINLLEKINQKFSSPASNQGGA